MLFFGININCLTKIVKISKMEDRVGRTSGDVFG